MQKSLPLAAATTNSPAGRPARIGRWVRHLPVLALLGLLGGAAQAQTVRTLPGDYASLAAAVTDLNTNGVPAGGVLVSVAAGHTETAANLLLTATGTSDSPIVFQKVGNGANPLVTAGVGVGAQDAVIALAGADYVTFEGIDVAENGANTTAAAQMEFGYALFRASATNGAQNNTIRNCAVTLNKTNPATIGIWSANTSSTAPAAIAATSSAGANSGNKVNGSTVSNAYAGIYFFGSTLASGFQDTGNEIGSAASNTLSDLGSGSTTTTVHGVRGENQNNFKVENNTITIAANYSGSGTLQAISLGSAAPTGMTGTLLVYNNTIRIATASTGAVYGIRQAGTSGLTNVSITSNKVQNCSLTGATGAVSYIVNEANGSTSTSTMQDNMVTNNTAATTGVVSGVYHNGTAGQVTISGNTISGLRGTGAAQTIYALRVSSGAYTVARNTVTDNAILTTSGTAASVIWGYYSLSSATVETLSNNTFTNLRVLGTGTSAATVVGGIRTDPSNTAIKNIFQNVIGNLATGSGGTVYGIFSASGTVINIYRNKVYDLSTANAGGTVNGISISAGTTTTLHNNLIGDLRAPAATGLVAINGLMVSDGTTINAYYNTIYLNASSTGSTFGTSGIYVNSATATLNVRNNLVINKSTAAGTGGYTATLRFGSGTAGRAPSNLAATSNANIYYAGPPSASNLIYVEGTSTATNASQTLAAYKALVANRENISQTEDTPFLSTTGASPTFLHLDPTVATLAEGKAEPINIKIDFDEDVRNSTTPDIGADEGSFTAAGAAVDLAVVELVAPATTGCYGAAETVLVAVRNNGTSPIDFAVNPATVTVRVTGASTQTLTATISSGLLAVAATQNVALTPTLDMRAGGTYAFAVTATAAGDGDAANDNLSATRTVVAPLPLPLPTVSFTGYTGSNLSNVFPGWTPATGATVPAGTSSAWTSATGVGGTGNVTAKINLYSTTRNEWIVGPKFTATATAQLKFRAAITDFNSTTAADGSGMTGTDDAVRVLVSTDCGITFTEVFQVNATNQPSATAVAFSDYTVSLAGYAGQALVVAFKATDGPAGNAPDYDFHLDNIELNEAQTSDVGVTALVAPREVGCYPAAQDVTVTIRNYGLSAQSGIPVRVVVGGPLTQTLAATFTGSIAAGATADFTVGQVDMTATGTYTFNATTQLPDDGNASNNALPQQTRTKVALASLPQQLNFTGYTGSNLASLYPGWLEATGALAPVGITSGWTSGDYANVTNGPNGTAAKINLYSNSKNEWLVGPRLLATASTVLTYELALTAFAETTIGTLGSDDRVEVRVSTDCGVTFTPVKSYTAATPISNTGQAETVALGAYAGQEIVVAFFATEGATDDTNDMDVFLDNISLSSPQPLDLAAAALVSPAASQDCYSATQAVTVAVLNKGTQTLDFAVNPATVTVSVTGATTQTLAATISSGTLAAGASQSVTLTPTLDMSSAGTYTFAVSATVQGDQNAANDALATAPTRIVAAPLAGIVTPGAASLCLNGSLTLTLTGAANGSIQWQQSTDNATFTDISGANAATYSTATLTSTTYFRARTTCNTNTATSNVATVTVSDPQVTSTNSPVAVCVGSAATLTATAAPGTTLRFFDTATGGTALASTPTATGASFTTPALSASQPYFVEAASSGTETVGRPAPAGGSGTTPLNYGLVFNTTSAATLTSVQVYPTGAAGTLVVQVQNSAGLLLPGLTATVAVPAGTGTTAFTVPLDFKLPPGTGFRLLAVSGPALVRETSLSNFPYTSPSGSVRITNGFISGTSSNYYYFYNWQVASECVGTRVPLQVNVTPAPTATLPATATSCASAAYQLTGTVGGSATTGTYSSTGTGTFSPDATTLSATYTPSAADRAAGSVALTLTAAGPAGTACAAATSTTVLTLTPTATATLSYASPALCVSGGPATPTVTGAPGGTFTSSPGLSINATTGLITPATSSAGPYTVTYSPGGSCAAPATFVVTINARPTQPTVSPAYNGATTTLTSSSTAGNQWYLNGVAIAGATAPVYVVSSMAQFGSYTVVVTTATTGCVSLPSLPLVVSSRVKPLAGSALSVYPNPTADGNVTVELRGYTKATELQVYNAVGQLVLRASAAGKSGVQTTPLDLRHLPAGVYFLRARTEGGLDVRRITKE